ncbi:MAG TPA: membrane protein insertion efficiency factor YidD [Burkholderiaceae bacterium]|nr:membrane protein insertion efficiency factor YidD [Burkholderiaceae bacterium]
MPQRLLIASVRAYRLLLSPWLGSSCRFEPTCSAYALQALQQHGATAGTYLTLRRLARCQPFCAGGHDPVPEGAPALFRRFLAASPRADGFLSPSSIDKNSP